MPAKKLNPKDSIFLISGLKDGFNNWLDQWKKRIKGKTPEEKAADKELLEAFKRGEARVSDLEKAGLISTGIILPIAPVGAVGAAVTSLGSAAQKAVAIGKGLSTAAKLKIAAATGLSVPEIDKLAKKFAAEFKRQTNKLIKEQKKKLKAEKKATKKRVKAIVKAVKSTKKKKRKPVQYSAEDMALLEAQGIEADFGTFPVIPLGDPALTTSAKARAEGYKAIPKVVSSESEEVALSAYVDQISRYF